MKIVVCIKQVPDTKGGVKFNPDGTLDRFSPSKSHVSFTFFPPVSLMSNTYRIPGFNALDGKMAIPLLKSGTAGAVPAQRFMQPQMHTAIPSA